MASLLIGIRRSVSTKNIVLDFVKSSLRKSCSRSKALMKRSNFYKLTFSSVIGFYFLNSYSYCAADDNKDDSKNNTNNKKNDEITVLITKMSPLVSKLGNIIIIIINLYHYYD
jgi:uncharacterized protein YqhQ